MAMTIGEASAVNRLLNYFLGSHPRDINPHVVTYEDAVSAAMLLAKGASKVLMAGINEEQARELFERMHNTALARVGIPAPLLDKDLMQAATEQLEASDARMKTPIHEGARVAVEQGKWKGRTGIAQTQNARNKTWYVRLTDSDRPRTVQIAWPDMSVIQNAE